MRFSWLLLLVAGLVCAEGIEVTGRARVVNGQTDVPRGLFGVHATPLTPERVADWGVESVRTIAHVPGGPATPPAGITHLVECFFDRYQPALIVEHADWAERLRTIARRYGEASRDLDRTPIVEFWNEPYLNWGVRPGVNYNGRFYKPGEPGERMTLRYADEPTEHMRWSENLVAVRTDHGRFDALASRHIPPGTRAGDTWTWRNQEWRAERQPWGRDPTQTSFWPGKQNVLWYNQMLAVFAPALKEANPDVVLVAGWDFHLYQNGWAAWEDVHRPTIDIAIEWMDGYAEHHYGGDTRLVAASYETTTAYTVTTHGKALKFYNTEAGGDLDPERPGPAQPGYNTTPPAVRNRAAYTYFMRDILHLIDKTPDKAEARAAHEAHHGTGVATGFRMLKPLRGTLMETTTPHTDIWAVSALNGSQLVVAVFNDTRAPLRMPLSVRAPRGSRFAGAVLRKPDADMRIVETAVEAAGETWSGSTDLAVRETGVWVFDLTGSPSPRRIHSSQFYAPDILSPLPEGGAVTTRIELPAEDLRLSTRAVLRLVHAGLNPGDHTLHVNGRQIDFQPGGIGILDLELPRTPDLRRENILELHRRSGGRGARLDSASIMIIPVILGFLVVQKHVVKSIAVGAVKG